MSVKAMNDIEKDKIDAGINTYRQVLIGPEEGPNFAMRRFIIEPGGSIDLDHQGVVVSVHHHSGEPIVLPIDQPVRCGFLQVQRVPQLEGLLQSFPEKSFVNLPGIPGLQDSQTNV